MTNALRAAACALVFLTFAASGALRAQAATAPIEVSLDATRAAQKFFRTKVILPASPGPFTFVYPRWIPGYHGPVGPIEAVVDLRVLARGAPLEWRRDLVDMYAIHTVVPPGASSVEVDFAVAGAPSHNGQSEVVSTAELAVLEFSNFVVYPQGATAEATQVRAQMTLPPGWTFGTALPVATRNAATVTFAPASLYTLVDSPIIAGAHEKAFPLGDGHELDAAGDAQSAIDLTPKFLTGMKHLIAEGPALYGGKHYRDYHFLLTLSEFVGFNGIEHHESSDNRAGEKYAQDDQQYRLESDLLAHEYS
ncbi:MAG: M61 family peptidase, partial [Candidatus Eremiobacteraeota bacterium]|nr:M61 family peptidase [Candidatus Eremiobacteraeota bacterium]